MATLASDELQKRLAKALRLSGDTHTIEDIQQAVARGTMQCFVSGDSFVVTEIVSSPRVKYLNIFLAVGDLSVLTTLPDIEEFARKCGCTWMQTTARHGWKKKLPKEWKPTHVLFVHDLGCENG